MKKELNSVINDSIVFIESRLNENLSINELAEQAFFSRTHYQRLFHSIIGEPVMEYVKKRRLQLACLELCETQATVLEIALKYGYSSHEGFSRAFKSNFGIAPLKYRKLNAKQEYKNKEEPQMLSKDVLSRITRNMETIAEVIEKFTNGAEKLCELTDKTVAKEGVRGTTVLILSQELKSLANRIHKIKESISGFIEGEPSIFVIYEKIYMLMKNLDDLAFQANVLAFFSGIETARIGEPRDMFIPIDTGYNDLCNSLVNNKNNIGNLIGGLIQLIHADIKREAINRIKAAADLLNQTINIGNEISEYAKSASDNKYGRAFLYIANEVEKKTTRAVTVKELLDCYADNIEKTDSFESLAEDRRNIATSIESLGYIAFYMNINAFNAAIETARSGNNSDFSICAERIRSYAGQLNKTNTDCLELFNECNKLLDLMRKGTKKNAAELTKKIIDDILFQSEILSTQFGLEAERINRDEFKCLAKNARELPSLTFVKVDDLKKPLTCYYEAILKIAADCHTEAAAVKNAGSFEYIASEYDKFSSRIRQIIDNYLSK